MGWIVDDATADHSVLGHTGSMLTRSSAQIIDPRTGIGVAVATETASMSDDTYEMARRLYATAAGAPVGPPPPVRQIVDGVLAGASLLAAILGALGVARARRWSERRASSRRWTVVLRLLPSTAALAVMLGLPWIAGVLFVPDAVQTDDEALPQVDTEAAERHRRRRDPHGSFEAVRDPAAQFFDVVQDGLGLRLQPVPVAIMEPSDASQPRTMLGRPASQVPTAVTASRAVWPSPANHEPAAGRAELIMSGRLMTQSSAAPPAETMASETAVTVFRNPRSCSRRRSARRRPGRPRARSRGRSETWRTPGSGSSRHDLLDELDAVLFIRDAD
jgi:hypothetical protein